MIFSSDVISVPFKQSSRPSLPRIFYKCPGQSVSQMFFFFSKEFNKCVAVITSAKHTKKKKTFFSLTHPQATPLRQQLKNLMRFLNKQGGSMISKEKIESDGENIALDTCSFLCREVLYSSMIIELKTQSFYSFQDLNCQGICHACWMHQQTFVVC